MWFSLLNKLTLMISRKSTIHYKMFISQTKSLFSVTKLFKPKYTERSVDGDGATPGPPGWTYPRRLCLAAGCGHPRDGKKLLALLIFSTTLDQISHFSSHTSVKNFFRVARISLDY